MTASQIAVTFNSILRLDLPTTIWLDRFVGLFVVGYVGYYWFAYPYCCAFYPTLLPYSIIASGCIYATFCSRFAHLPLRTFPVDTHIHPTLWTRLRTHYLDRMAVFTVVPFVYTTTTAPVPTLFVEFVFLYIILPISYVAVVYVTTNLGTLNSIEYCVIY